MAGLVRRAAALLMRQAARRLAGDRPEWSRAMAAEYARIDDDRAAFSWALGCGKVVLMSRMTPMTLLYALLLALGAAAILYFEWHTDEVTVVLALLLVVAALLGFFRPGAAVTTGLVVGVAIPLAHLASELSGRFPPPYQTQPPSLADAVVMAGLVLAGLAAAFAGAWARRLVSS